MQLRIMQKKHYLQDGKQSKHMLFVNPKISLAKKIDSLLIQKIKICTYVRCQQGIKGIKRLV